MIEENYFRFRRMVVCCKSPGEEDRKDLMKPGLKARNVDVSISQKDGIQKRYGRKQNLMLSNRENRIS